MTSWRLWARTSVGVAHDEEGADRAALAAFQAKLAGEGQEPLEDGGGDVGGQGFGGRAAEHLDLGAEVEDDHRIDRPRAVEPGHADDPVPLRRSSPLGGGDEGATLIWPTRVIATSGTRTT